MKKELFVSVGVTVTFVLIFIALFSFLDKSEKANVYKGYKGDTVSTFGFFYSPYSKEYQIGGIIRVGRDTVMLITSDSVTFKMGLTRWYDYYEAYVDSSRDENRKARLDSNGKAIFQTYHRALPHGVVIKDAWTNVDSLLKIYLPKLKK